MELNAGVVPTEEGALTTELKLELEDLRLNLATVSTEFEQISKSNSEHETNDTPSGAIKAAAIGGLFSLVQDVALTTVTKDRSRYSNLWENAIQAAKISGETHTAERAFHASEVSIRHLAGTHEAKNVGFVCHGFMTSDFEHAAHLWKGWAESLDMILYRIIWPTGSQATWDQFLKKTTVDPKQWFARLTSNPWHVAQDKTVQVGQVLARFFETKREELTCFKGRKTFLIGHSLGGAIVYHTLRHAKSNGIVDHAIVLAGAFLPRKESILNVLGRVNGIFINVYSKNDQILQTAFRAVNLNAAQAAGNIPILVAKDIAENAARQKIFDLDMTSFIPANESTLYGHHYSENDLLVIASKIMALVQ